jgi:hypothetical protein
MTKGNAMRPVVLQMGYAELIDVYRPTEAHR